MRNKEFGLLLSEGVRSVANRQRQKIADVEADIGEQLGFTRYMVEYWRRGYIPVDPIVAFLAKYCVQNGHVGYEWMEKFLKQVNYPDTKELLIALFPSHLYFFLSYQDTLEPAQAIVLEVPRDLIIKIIQSSSNKFIFWIRINPIPAPSVSEHPLPHPSASAHL